MTKHKSALSASRIKTLQQCSWKYWCNYILKLPDKSNDGASRGWICHLIFELLGNPRHLKNYKLIIDSGSIFACPALEKLVMHHATRLNVSDEDNLKLMDEMTMNGLHYDFFGEDDEAPDEAISEQYFDIEICKDDISFRMRGFIDKLFLYKDKSYALIRDFKSNKQMFKGKEITDNLQNLMYSMAIRHLYPEVKKTESEFLFLKFDMEKDMFNNPGKGVLRMDPVLKEELTGLEYELSEIQEYIDTFDEEKATANYAANQGYPKDGTFGGPLACGKDGYKMRQGKPLLDKKGEPIVAFICSHRKPMEYYALIEDEKVIKTCFTENKEDLIKIQKENQEIKLMEYSGCPHWYAPEHVDLFD